MVLISGARELRFDTSLVMEEDEESAGRNLIYYKFTLSMIKLFFFLISCVSCGTHSNIIKKMSGVMTSKQGAHSQF